MPIPEIAGFIRRYDRFLIAGHARPDGDSLGSALALAAALEELGKCVQVVNADRHSRNYNTLPGIDSIKVGPKVDGDWEALIILECNNLQRSGIDGLGHLPAVNIDHHPKNDFFAEINWVDPSAAAVGEMIYSLILELGLHPSVDVATNLYVALLTDTGSFQFSNTTADTLRIASELVNFGANPAAIARDVLLTQPEARLRLIGRLLETLQLDPTRKIAWIVLTREMLEATGAEPDDIEGLVNYPLSIEGVEVCAFFKEQSVPADFRVSLRSKGRYNVGLVAEGFGGGGHKNAAGLSVAGSYETVRDRVIGELERLLA